jgi:hypothetical protein
MLANQIYKLYDWTSVTNNPYYFLFILQRYESLLLSFYFPSLLYIKITACFCKCSVFFVCHLQALKVLRSAEYAPFVVFIAAPSALDLQLAKTAGIDVSYNIDSGLI